MPLAWGLFSGQVQGLVTALALGGMIALERRRTLLGGAALAFACISKIFPLVLLAWLLARRRWSALAAVAAWGAAYCLALYALDGAGPFLAFIHYQLPRIESLEAFHFLLQSPAHIAQTQSWVGLYAKLHALGVLQDMAALKVFQRATQVAVVAVAIWAARLPDRSRMFRAQVWLVALNIAMRASPAGTTLYFEVGTVLLLILLFAEQPRRLHGWLLGVSMIALNAFPLIGLSQALDIPPARFFLSMPVLIFCVGAWMLGWGANLYVATLLWRRAARTVTTEIEAVPVTFGTTETLVA
jgi:hypothetical protein